MLYLILALVVAAAAEKVPSASSPNWKGLDLPPNTFIVGGAETPRGAYPWQIGLERCSGTSCSHSCGAVLIANTWAITAAHCVSSTSMSAYNFVVGQHVRGTIPRGDPRRMVPTRIVKHPLYRQDGSAGFPNDIAVVQFGKSAPVGPLVKPAALPPRHPTDYTSSECWISGWGRLSGSGRLPTNLQHAKINVLSTEACRARWGSRIKEIHICIYDSAEQKRGSCNGDSGGPLNCKVGSGWQVAGVTSWGIVGCRPSHPSVYARTSYFRNWIREQTGVYEEEVCDV